MNLSIEPLSQYNRLHTHHADKLEDFLGKKDLGVELPAQRLRRTPPLHAIINACYLPNS